MRISDWSSDVCSSDLIKKTITNVLGLWLNPLVDAATAASDFDLRQLRQRPMSIYLGVSPDELDRIAPLAAAWSSASRISSSDIAQSCAGRKLRCATRDRKSTRLNSSH